jgi:hypothetical protein
MATRQLLKRDNFGSICVYATRTGAVVVRDVATAQWHVRWLARRLARREARALAGLAGEPRIPTLLAFDGFELRRSHLPGLAMHVAAPPDARYFKDALKLLSSMHRRGIAHNDLAKEANWLTGPDGSPGIVDFQLVVVAPKRGALFRLLAREDLRHLLKHKRRYTPERLTARQKHMLATPALPARLWRLLVKPPYLFVTRKVLAWPERDGAEERKLEDPSI